VAVPLEIVPLTTTGRDALPSDFAVASETVKLLPGETPIA
jgi:hypothetical protein